MQVQNTLERDFVRLKPVIQSNQQRARRHPTFRGAVIRPCLAAAGASKPAVVCNVSGSGLGLFVFHRFQADTRLLVEFNDVPVEAKTVRVAHATENEDGVILGCELDAPFTDAELQALREPEA